MKIGHKIALSLLAVTMSLVVLFSGIEVPILVGNFRDLQQKQAEGNLARSQQAIQTELNALGRQAKDWGCWDDTYAFVQDHNDRFRQVNLTDDLFDTTQVDLLFIVDKKGEIIDGRLRTPDGKVKQRARGLDPKMIALGTSTMLGPSKSDHAEYSGVYEIDGLPVLIFARPITDSAQRKHTAGSIIMGRFMTDDRVNGISLAIGVPFTIIPRSTLTGEQISKLAGEQEEYVETPSEHSNVVGYRVLNADGQSPRYLVQASTVPDILRDGQRAVHDVERFFIISAFVATIFGLLLANFVIANPLKGLADRLTRMGEDPAAEVGEKFSSRVDEIGSLARSFEATLERLAAAQRRLLYASHEAGMTEVARAILHNAGNVLNSVSVSVRQLRTQAENSHLDGLRKAVQMLGEHESDMAAFVDSAKGKKLIAYLRAISQKLDSEQKAVKDEIQVLIASTKHLADVVQDQRSLADRPENLINLKIIDVLADSIQVVDRAFARHHIVITVECTPMCRAEGDPSKLQQVIVNLLTNAKEALLSTPIGDRRIRISARSGDFGHISLKIEDTGMGITPDQMDRIFQQGFTTKQDGTGFGLHYCANVLKEMGWSIRAESAGVGRGSAFIIESKTIEAEAAA